MNDMDQNTEIAEVTVTSAITQPDTVLFPFALTPLVLDNPGNIEKVEKAASGDRLIAVFPEMPENKEVWAYI